MASNPLDDPLREPDNQEGPREINMTDLEAERDYHPSHGTDAAGTPGGGAAAGGLAGTNIDDGAPDNADLDDALGSGLYDTDGDEQENAEEERGWRKWKRLMG